MRGAEIIVAVLEIGTQRLGRRIGDQAPQDRIDQAGRSTVSVTQRKIDRFKDGGVRVDAVHQADLISTQPENLADRLGQLLGATGEIGREVPIEQAPPFDRTVR